MTKLTCPVCNTEFEPTNPTQQKYCSIKCKNSVKRKKANKRRSEQRKMTFEEFKIGTCLLCGAEFERTFGTYGYKQKYCSSKCRRKAESVLGDKSLTDKKYKDELRFGGNKLKVMQRDGFRCRICNKKLNLVVHHKDQSGQSETPNNELDNLVTLCRTCHVNIHRVL